MFAADCSNCSGLVSAFLTIERRLRAVLGSLDSWSVACHNPAQHEADHGEADERRRFTSSADHAICPIGEAVAGLLQQVEALRDNQKACRHAAQQICRAGVTMPEALTALAAFALTLFDAMQPADHSDSQRHSPARYKLLSSTAPSRTSACALRSGP